LAEAPSSTRVTVFTSQRTAPVNAHLSSLSTKKLIIQ
jgi:hypothetical protein